MIKKIVLDFEFTGLDNTFIKDNEIIQMKAVNLSNNENFIENYGSDKKNTIGAYLKHRIDNHGIQKRFSKKEFEAAIESIGVSKSEIYDETKVEYYGYSVSQDLMMIDKYGIELNIKDIKEMMQLCDDYEYKLATEGNSLECAYHICFGSYSSTEDHSGMHELLDIVEILLHIEKLNKNKYLKYVPFGHCAGMEITQYISDYRRSADGYRFNNSDLFSDSLSHYIHLMEENEDYNDF